MKTICCTVLFLVLARYGAEGSVDAKIGQIFHNMDLNKDFFIIADEISGYFTTYDQQAGAPGEAVSIDLAEYKAGWAKYGDTEAQMEHNFNVMDVNKDKALTAIDLGNVFVTADVNKDMRIDFEEFHNYMITNIYNI